MTDKAYIGPGAYEAMKPGAVHWVDETPPIDVVARSEMTAGEKLLDTHQQLTLEAFELMKTKNHDYTSGGGDPFANFRMASAMGISPVTGICLRIGDKLQRLRTFAEKGELHVKGEGVRDAALDIINYAVLCYGLSMEESDDGKSN